MKHLQETLHDCVPGEVGETQLDVVASKSGRLLRRLLCARIKTEMLSPEQPCSEGKAELPMWRTENAPALVCADREIRDALHAEMFAAPSLLLCPVRSC